MEELTASGASDIRLVTTVPHGLFKQRLAALIAQMSGRGATVAAKINGASHDRYYIVDERRVWTLGASFNQAGTKATSGHEIQDTSERDRIINDFKQWWASGKAV